MRPEPAHPGCSPRRERGEHQLSGQRCFLPSAAFDYRFDLWERDTGLAISLDHAEQHPVNVNRMLNHAPDLREQPLRLSHGVTEDHRAPPAVAVHEPPAGDVIDDDGGVIPAVDG